MDKILFDSRWIGDHGIGRFAKELQSRIPGLTPFESRRPPFHPVDPFLLSAALRFRKPRLYFSPGYNCPWRYSGAFIFTLHDLNHLKVQENSSALKRAYYESIIKPACRNATRVLTVSEYSRCEITAWAGVPTDQIVNVGNGVGPQFVADGPRYNPGYSYLLYVGSRKTHKNLVRLLHAYSLSGVRSDVRLIISGVPDKFLASEIHRLGLNADVQFREIQSDQELSSTYRGAVGLVFPSLYEGFGLPPVEAMACGTPVLTSNVCSLPEVVGNAALLVNPLDVSQIAEGIRRLVQDSELRESLRARGVLRAKKFSWEKTANITMQVLELSPSTIHEGVFPLAGRRIRTREETLAARSAHGSD